MRTTITRSLVGLVVLGLIATSTGTVGAGTTFEKDIVETDLPQIQAGNIGCPGLAIPSPVILALMTHTAEDVYCLAGNAGDVVTIQADTTDAVTTHDLWAGICAGGSKTFVLGLCAFFDDNFGCTFPPPAFSCPRGTVILPATGSYTVFVGSWGTWGGAHPGPYLYELSVDVNGSSALLDLNSFDQGQTGP